MPLYLYRHPTDGSTREIYQSMNDEHIYFEDGVEFQRIFTVPTASIDTQIDPYNSKDFVKVTNKNGTLGDMLDRSKELSEKRAEKEGVDPVRQAYYDKHKEKTGKTHYLEAREKGVKSLKEKGISLEFTD